MDFRPLSEQPDLRFSGIARFAGQVFFHSSHICQIGASDQGLILKSSSHFLGTHANHAPVPQSLSPGLAKQIPFLDGGYFKPFGPINMRSFVIAISSVNR
jgi:hypothetical protein